VLTEQLTLPSSNIRHPVYLVRHGYSASLEHLVVELFLLQVGQFGLELVVVDSIGGRALGKCTGDFFADGVLLFEILPVVVWLVFDPDDGSHNRETTYIVASTLSIVRPPWIFFMALEALLRASRVSLLMFAVSMLAI